MRFNIRSQQVDAGQQTVEVEVAEPVGNPRRLVEAVRGELNIGASWAADAEGVADNSGGQVWMVRFSAPTNSP